MTKRPDIIMAGAGKGELTAVIALRQASFGVVYGTMAAYPVMVRQGSGHILNVASLTGLMPTPARTP